MEDISISVASSNSDFQRTNFEETILDDMFSSEYVKTLLLENRPDIIDGCDSEEESCINSPETNEIIIVSEDNTYNVDINKINSRDMDFFRSQNEQIISAIMHSDFSDGMDNDVTLCIRKFVHKNRYVAYDWMHELYINNQSQPIIVVGLLRSLVMVTEPEDEAIMLTMVKSAMNSNNTAEQEAALMIIEEWRSKECLEILHSLSHFSSEWLSDYAHLVSSELEKELESC